MLCLDSNTGYNGNGNENYLSLQTRNTQYSSVGWEKLGGRALLLYLEEKFEIW